MCIHGWNNYSHHRYYNAWNKLDYRIWPKVIKETTQQSRQLSSRKQIFLTEGQINNRKILPPVQDAQCTSNNKGCKGLCSCPIINPFNDENGHDRRESNRHLDKQAYMSALEIFKIKKEGATPRVWGLYTVYMSWHQAREYIHNWRDDDVNIMMLRSRKDSQAICLKQRWHRSCRDGSRMNQHARSDTSKAVSNSSAPPLSCQQDQHQSATNLNLSRNMNQIGKSIESAP